MLDLQAVRAFRETARTLSFSQAAEVLQVSQPAISMKIQGLEKHLGVSLFDRGPGGTSLTRHGETFLPLADRLLRMAAAAEESVQASYSEISGRLTVGCSSTAGKYVLPELVAGFLRSFPEVDVKIHVLPRNDMLEGVVNGSIDLGVTSLRSSNHDVAYSPLFTDHLSLIVPSNHPWARDGTVQATALVGERFICREPESACREIVNSALRPTGVSLSDLQIVMEVGSAEALALAVERGIGFAFVSILAALPRVNLGRLAFIEIEEVRLVNCIELATCPTRPASPAAGSFLTYVQRPRNRTLLDSLAEGLHV